MVETYQKVPDLSEGQIGNALKVLESPTGSPTIFEHFLGVFKSPKCTDAKDRGFLWGDGSLCNKDLYGDLASPESKRITVYILN